MQSPIDLNKVLKRKGLDPSRPYIGVVVDDNDPDKLARIKVRVPVLHDPLEDSKLPWAVPENFDHPEGLMGGEQRSGKFNGVPRVQHKVAVYFRHGGDANNPSYGPVPIDQQNILPEFEVNYPNRRGIVTRNGYTIIFDSKTDEIFIHNPGDLNLTILGDVNQTVVGDLQQIITGSTSDIPGYLLNAPETVLSQLSPNQQKQVEWKGLLGTGSGNYHTEVKGDWTMNVGGNVKHEIGGRFERNVGSSVKENAGSNHDIKASVINLN